MKIYIASSFSLIPKVEVVSDALEAEGYEVLCKWWTGLDYIPSEQQSLKEKAGEVFPDTFYSYQGTKSAYERDFSSVEEADVLVFVADDNPRRYNGANIELGMALAYRHPCFSLGVFQNSAMYWGVNRCTNLHELLSKLGEVRSSFQTTKEET